MSWPDAEELTRRSRSSVDGSAADSTASGKATPEVGIEEGAKMRERLRALARKIERHRKALAESYPERDRLIREALDAGNSEREVAEWADMSGARVHQIKEAEPKENVSG